LIKGGEKLKEEKLKQLRIIFEKEIRGIVNHSFKTIQEYEKENYINRKASQLVYEVKIRINDK